ncbi:hypothetical protein Cob_v012831 [Colletotrichum orbiculare MAFF 240422]|uniref:Uncharacterized protein n=1 Tax=Colletotrichum orbiculare (strain 104-T / ATCC 96160 / CBS 514.97 / LARS 414 / MAFF 240422) TaxID=1213857 RepID=A0A484F7P0_COLOR|nr:hypothetical protein Cob_v012831 [Colletotrichum orbiculare MAFF 240422]
MSPNVAVVPRISSEDLATPRCLANAASCHVQIVPWCGIDYDSMLLMNVTQQMGILAFEWSLFPRYLSPRSRWPNSARWILVRPGGQLLEM